MNHSQMLKPMLIGAAVLFGLSLFGVPVGSFLPFLILLVCPLMMIFMMRGMDHGGGHGPRDEDAHAGHGHREQT
ncbi:DUF2933 domain-containing protein [Iamia sp. SCSIO 61187]|uniref:DUF2933 domain-containing protein n=1 Tax=Iamia sp. SCSIO 61187 TaxID=2722752 RepID=UPI0021029EE9|nr:DUF2933 domain-containing protein [Iamia sp. SCSIO 61187]QYG94226.1 DUF2933 domain-containing protein [Iamia sp. SCSIO 61187]